MSWLEIIYTFFLSFCLIFIIHHIYAFLQSNLTLLNPRDLVITPETYALLEKQQKISTAVTPVSDVPPATAVTQPNEAQMEQELSQFMGDLLV